MSRLMKRNLCYIRKLNKARGSKAKANILDSAPRDLLDAISEGAHNVLKGNVRLSKPKFRALKRQKRKLYELASKKASRKKKRQIVQRGGFMGLLASVLIPTIASLIARK